MGGGAGLSKIISGRAIQELRGRKRRRKMEEWGKKVEMRMLQNMSKP